MDLFWLWGQPGLQMEFQVSQGCTVRFPSLKWTNISEGGARRWFSWQSSCCTSMMTWAGISNAHIKAWMVVCSWDPTAGSAGVGGSLQPTAQRIDELQPLWEALSQKQRWGVIDGGTCSWSLTSTCMWTLEHEHSWSYMNTPTRTDGYKYSTHTYKDWRF